MNVAGEVSDAATDHKTNLAVECNSAQQVLKTLDEEAAHAGPEVPNDDSSSDSGSVETESTELSSEVKSADVGDAGLAITSGDDVASGPCGEQVSSGADQHAETSVTEKDKLSGEKNQIVREAELVETAAKVSMDGCGDIEEADDSAENSCVSVPANIISTVEAKSGQSLKMEDSESKETPDYTKSSGITTINKTSNTSARPEKDHGESLADGAVDNEEAVAKDSEMGMVVGGGSNEDSTANEQVSAKVEGETDKGVSNIATNKKTSFFTKLNDIFDMKALNFKSQKSNKKKSVLEARKPSGDENDDDTHDEKNLVIADKGDIVEAVEEEEKEKEKSVSNSAVGRDSISDAQSSSAIKPDSRRFSLRDIRDKVYGKTAREGSSENEEIPGFIGYFQSFMKKKDKKSIIDDNHSIIFGGDAELVIQSEVGEACKEVKKEQESRGLNQDNLDAKKEPEQNEGTEVKEETEENETIPVEEEAEAKENVLAEEAK
ncbi:hypothetical protein AYI69_g8923, partial [Smittium culicis]